VQSTVNIETLLNAPRQAVPNIPGYRIRALLGRGGMGIVYAAQRGQTEELVAIKLLRSDVATPATLARFDRERRILERLDHPDVARLLESGKTPEGTPYLVMEYIQGQTIVDYCETQRLQLQQRLRLFYRVCLAVSAAHKLEIIHRDLKPANILVTADGCPKLLDFGIAKLATQTRERLTVTGCRLLTPEYASIEQIRGGAVTPASDVYSLGVILAEIAGHCDARLRGVIEHATAERLELRYSSADEFSHDIAAYITGGRLQADTKWPRLSLWAIAFSLAIIAIVAMHLRSYRIEAAPTSAERDYMVARHLWNKLSVPELRKAEAWFRKAVQEDDGSAQAHAGLADALYFLGELGGRPPRTAFIMAKAEAQRAVELDEASPVAHAVLGSVLVASDLSWSAGEREFKKALKLDARCVRALQGYGCMLMRAGRLDEAREMIERARLLDPASPILGVLEARISFYNRQYERARDQLRGVIDRESTFALAHYYLALVHQYLGHSQAAELEMKQIGASEKSIAIEIAWLRAHNGKPEAARRLLEAGTEGSSMVFVAAELGDAERAFAVLQAAIDARSPLMLAMRVDPRFDKLRSDPRFSMLLLRAGFEK
jgi:Tfp pilus assembly protein PilF